ncbi:MAG: dienelactone hydrolase family protein [Litorilinea sp.]
MSHNQSAHTQPAHTQPAHTQPDGYLARPAHGTDAPVLVLHAWWGLNATVKAFCDRLADAGFIAFAPDLYHGALATTIEEAETLGTALDNRQHEAQAEIAQAAAFLHAQTQQDAPIGAIGADNRGIAVIGFSLGAYYALELADAQPDRVRAVVVFYGTGSDNFANSQATYLGHFAAQDDYEPAANVDALETALMQAGRPVTFYRYPDTGHWFLEPDRTDAYNHAAATLAWSRTLAFLQAAAADPNSPRSTP